MSDSPYIIEGTKENFADLVAKSQELPVLVDFWADWCGPCKQLTPVLEKLAAEYQGRFLLAKINTESEQELAAHFQIRSIPSIKIIKGGAIVDEFMGVQPEAVIREMLDRHCGDGPPPDGEGQPEEAVDELSQMAMAQFAQGDTDGAIANLTGAVAADPANHSARITLAQLQIAAGEFDDAQASLDAIPEEARDDRYNSISGMFDFARIIKDAPPPEELEGKLAADAGDTLARYQLSAFQMLGNRPDDACENLLEIVRTDRKFEDDAARNALIKVFNVIGPDHPLTAEYRRKLARLLN